MISDTSIVSTDPSSMKCPECGKPMPLVTYVGPPPTCYRCQSSLDSGPTIF